MAAVGLIVAGGLVIKAVALPATHTVQVAAPQDIATGQSRSGTIDPQRGLKSLDGQAPVSNVRSEGDGAAAIAQSGAYHQRPRVQLP
jgi:hypothetical protein